VELSPSAASGTLLKGSPWVKATLARAGITAAIAKMTANIEDLTTKLDALITQITAKDAEINTLSININYYQSDLKTYQKEFNAAVTSQTAKIAERIVLARKKNTLTLQKKALEARIAYLNSAMPADPVLPAWCADLTKDLSGEVATIEVPGERGALLIRPGYADQAAYNGPRDGQLNPAINQTPEQCFYNLAMLPGWQKWMPAYRFGEITAIDKVADTCSVLLEDIKSSQQLLGINKVTSLSDIPVEYMT
jgi:hypothetical protein